MRWGMWKMGNAGGKLNDFFGITVGGFDIMRFCGIALLLWRFVNKFSGGEGVFPNI